MKTEKVERNFQRLLAGAEEVVRGTQHLKRVSDLENFSVMLGHGRGYCFHMFVRSYGLLVPMDKPGDYFIFENQKEANEFKKLLAAEKLKESEESVPDKVVWGGVNTPKIVGKSEAIKKVLGLTELVAKTRATVLFLGESGTGKELFARIIHALSPRRENPFVAINCSAIPETLIESELFGHERGAFTDAKNFKLGRFELADGGTLFLDEIGELPLLVQVKILRFLQDQTFERVGGTSTLKADVRIVTATNSDLIKALKEKRFREDLYYRLNVFPITIPPLRERLDDILPLLEYFLAKFSVSMCIDIPVITPEIISAIMAHSWPGNVRELENLIERALIYSQGRGILSLKDFTLDGTVPCFGVKIDGPNREGKPKLPASLRELETFAIERALQETGGNKTRAAKLLGISVKTLYNRLKYHFSVAR